MKIPNNWEFQLYTFLSIIIKLWSLVKGLTFKIFNKVLTEKQKKDRYYHHVKGTNMSILQVKKY